MAKEKGKVRLMKTKADLPSDLLRTFQTAIDLPAPTRSAMIELLNQQLANTTDLYSQVKQSHWNIKGIHFYPLHLLFDELAEHLEEDADELAERATALGGFATGTVRIAAMSTQIPELPDDINEGIDYVRALVERYGLQSANARKAIETANEAGDLDTADLFTQISRHLDKDLWFLQAHLQD